ncbi:winged helix DNA-binding domain-containing protein [Saccharopolyspora pogona]|uniref:winged helix DNA-binding domain-containing protein n=1 Tax=Saccharopolyspora pogona TaxID=333966 RepID=UPI001685818B|nr:winged helix DNA-binding domain-containing protein [Saccharopolyspora pogona]
MTMLGRRELNRATLERQLLLRRSERSAVETIDHLVGMQAQAPFPPYFGLWTRLARFQPDDLAQRLLDRSVVRIVLMRGTVHLVSAADCLRLRPLVQPIMGGAVRTNTQHRAEIAGIDHAEIAALGRELLDEQPRTAAQLGPLLAERWPDRKPASLAFALRNLLPLVQIPPRAVWGRSGQPTYATAETWLGRPLAAEPSLEDVLRRYLAAFGPATVADMQVWSGLRGLKEVVPRLDLRTFRDENGRQLLDLPDAPRPDPDVPSPPRFLAPFDNVLLSHKDRSRVMHEDGRKRLFSMKNAVLPGTILVDGFLHGTWRLARRKHTATLLIEPYRKLPEEDADAVALEGRRLLQFAEPDAADHDVQITPVAV